jgi:purine-nucleoside phosphorylase
MSADPARRIAAFLRRKLPAPPRAAVVLGSGLGAAALGRPGVTVPYRSIPGFPRTSVPGHPGALSLVGRTAVLRGRVHFYEGFDLEAVTRPVRALALLGVRTVVLTNAAGGIAPGLRAGDLLLIRDHLNLMGANPLRGRARFVDLSDAYDPELRRRALAAAKRAGIRLRPGVYAALPGPSYETPAEVRMLRRLGADAVGMSTVPEAIAARAAGMRVLGISIIANAAAGAGKGGVSHEEVLRETERASDRLARLLRGILAGMEAGGPS